MPKSSLRAIALIENRALNEQAPDSSLPGRQYFSACVELAANSAEFFKQFGHGKLQALWMVYQKAGDLWVLPLSFNQREDSGGAQGRQLIDTSGDTCLGLYEP
jgi:hypothetical protein